MLIAATAFLLSAELERPELPIGVQAYTDVAYRAEGLRRPRLDIYIPDAPVPRDGRPALIAIHGGGWRGGHRAEYGRSLLEFVEKGLVVVSVDYQLSTPGAPSWPRNLEDIRDAIRWVHSHAKDYGVDPDKLALIGASAGAHLALVAGLQPDETTRVSAIIDFYGPTDLLALAQAWTDPDEPIAPMLGGRPEMVPGRYESASPLRLVSRESPSVLILHGEQDTRVPLAESRALDGALADNGVPHQLIVVSGARHGFGLHVYDRDLTPEILEFLENVWHRRGKS